MPLDSRPCAEMGRNDFRVGTTIRAANDNSTPRHCSIQSTLHASSSRWLSKGTLCSQILIYILRPDARSCGSTQSTPSVLASPLLSEITIVESVVGDDLMTYAKFLDPLTTHYVPERPISKPPPILWFRPFGGQFFFFVI